MFCARTNSEATDIITGQMEKANEVREQPWVGWAFCKKTLDTREREKQKVTTKTDTTTLHRTVNECDIVE